MKFEDKDIFFKYVSHSTTKNRTNKLYVRYPTAGGLIARNQ